MVWRSLPRSLKQLDQHVCLGQIIFKSVAVMHSDDDKEKHQYFLSWLHFKRWLEPIKFRPLNFGCRIWKICWTDNWSDLWTSTLRHALWKTTSATMTPQPHVAFIASMCVALFPWERQRRFVIDSSERTTWWNSERLQPNPTYQSTLSVRKVTGSLPSASLHTLQVLIPFDWSVWVKWLTLE